MYIIIEIKVNLLKCKKQHKLKLKHHFKKKRINMNRTNKKIKKSIYQSSVFLPYPQILQKIIQK